MPKKKPKKSRPYTHKDVDKEWQQIVKNRAIEQNVSEDDVIRWGLHYPFKEKKAEEDYKQERLSLLRGILSELKKGGK